MITVKRLGAIFGLAVLVAAFAATPALASEPAPAWSASSSATPTAFVVGKHDSTYRYDARFLNIGAAPTDGSPLTLTITLPEGLEVVGDPLLEIGFLPPGTEFYRSGGEDIGPTVCSTQVSDHTTTVTCIVPKRYIDEHNQVDQDEPSLVDPTEELVVTLHVFVPAGTPEGERLTDHVEVEGGGAASASFSGENETATLASDGRPMSPPAGFSYYRSSITGPDGLPAGQAGSHPYQFITSYAVDSEPAKAPGSNVAVSVEGDIKDVKVALPPGLVGNPMAIPRCTAQQFIDRTFVSQKHLAASSYHRPDCPVNTAVGMVIVQNLEGSTLQLATPLFNLVPSPGLAAQFGFAVGEIPFYIDSQVRSGTDYGVTSSLQNLSQISRLIAATVVIWGTPADSSHDPLRGACLNPSAPYLRSADGSCPAGIPPIPFLRTPTSCQSPLQLPIAIDRWSDPGLFYTGEASYPAPDGCDQVEFEPSLEAKPTTDVADSPSGLDARLHIPQNEDPESLGTADLRDTTVSLPKGLSINPSSANGLAACAPSDIGLTSAVGAVPAQFNPGPSACPDASRIGTAEVDTPLVDHPLQGGVFVASPRDNPFGSLLAIYVAINDAKTGINLKLAGEVHADPTTGQLTTSFTDTPQQPFEDFKFEFFGGAGAALRTPAVCGEYVTESTMTPWSAPESGPPVTSDDHYAISRGPGSGMCPTTLAALPNSPTFSAGTESPLSGIYSPLVISLRREDGSQEFGQLTLTPPPGLLARLAGIPYCPDGALAEAEGKSGREEQAHPSCPAASRIGTVTVGAGAGPAPYFTTGSAYLTGPYKGAPLSLAIVTPAVAGPYDLGTVVVRSALQVNPETTQITAVSDPIPHILQGIPLDIRSISVKLDHLGWGLNPTSCEAHSFGGQETSVSGQNATLSNRFQVGECGRLAFRPKLALSLIGATKHAGNPGLKAVLTMPAGGANIARAQVNLPHGEFLDQGNLNKTCTRPVLLVGNCPASTVYGKVQAWTPLLEKPLQGNVYLVGGYGYKLPALVAELDGQIRVLLAGKVDSGPNRGIRNTFEVVPDAPVEKFILELKGGKKYSLLENSENLCKAPSAARRAIVRFTGQNGAVEQLHPLVRAACGKAEPHRGSGGKKNAKAKHHRGSGGKNSR
jgi:hypothetical protein